jgi:hypothetical protein
VQVVGDAGFLDMADIKVADKDGNLVATFTSVAVGTTITVPESLFGGSYPSSIRITILDPASGRKAGTPTAYPLMCMGESCVTFHTSCSQPLRVGDQFGNIRVVDYVNDNGHSGAECVRTTCTTTTPETIPATTHIPCVPYNGPSDPHECPAIVSAVACEDSYISSNCPAACSHNCVVGSIDCVLPADPNECADLVKTAACQHLSWGLAIRFNCPGACSCPEQSTTTISYP